MYILDVREYIDEYQSDPFKKFNVICKSKLNKFFNSSLQKISCTLHSCIKEDNDDLKIRNDRELTKNNSQIYIL